MSKSKQTKQVDMKMRAYKMRFYPTSAQKKLLAQAFGTKRYIYNWALTEKTRQWRENKVNVDFKALSKQMTLLKKEQTWLNTVSSSIPVQALADLKTAYKNFFDKKLAAKFPVKKKRRWAQSCRMQLDQRQIHNNFSNKPGAEFIRAPGLGKLNVKFTRKISGLPKMITLSKNAMGEYYVSIACKEVFKPKPQTNRTVGVDVGIKNIAVDSNGIEYGNPAFYQKQLKRLKKHQRRLSKKVEKSHRWHKQRMIVAKIHDRVAHCRRDYLHLISNKLIDENQVIALETLNVKGMLKNRKLARKLADAAMSELKRQIKYKADWFNRDVIEIDRWFPSSQLCSNQGCDYRNHDLTLSDRSWTCPQCQTRHDRDINAANNILIEGLNKYREERGHLPAGLNFNPC